MVQVSGTFEIVKSLNTKNCGVSDGRLVSSLPVAYRDWTSGSNEIMGFDEENESLGQVDVWRRLLSLLVHVFFLVTEIASSYNLHI